MRFLRFSRVVWRMMRPPVSSSAMETTGRPSRWSKPGWASLMRSPVMTRDFFTSTVLPSESRYLSVPKGAGWSL